MYTLVQMGPWTSVLIIKVSLLVRCPDSRGLMIMMMLIFKKVYFTVIARIFIIVQYWMLQLVWNHGH